MSTISTGIGLISGINIDEIVTALINAQRTPIVRLEQRASALQATSLGVDVLGTTLLTLKSSVSELGKTETFEKLAVSTPEGANLDVTAGSDATAGSYQFRAVRRTTNHHSLSRGFASEETFQSGTLTIATGGRLQSSRTLDLLNGGAGVRRGAIRITDRGGQSATVDLSGAHTVDDVLTAINAAELSVAARVVGDHFVLTDTSGSTVSDLSVTELSGGHTAADLGLLQSAASNTLTGQSVYYASDDFTLEHINDGNAWDNAVGLADLQVTHGGGAFEVNLDDARTVGDVLEAINAAGGGTVAATLADGRIQLTDSGGGPLAVANLNGASVARELGLDVAAAGGTLTGRSLTGGLNSVLLRNLFGGQGVTQLGSIQLTDRAGNSAVVDLSAAETLDDVIEAINAAETSGGVKLQLSAGVDEAGTRIRIDDTSGATAGNLVIADQAGSTLAAQFGIAVDAPQTGVTSGALHLRYVSGGTRLDSYARGGEPVAEGSFLITDALGNTSTVLVDSTVETLDDLFTRIRTTAPDVGVELNATGDGFRLYSLSGTGALSVQDGDSSTAFDLGLVGTGEPDGSGASEIVSRRSVEIAVEEGDTLGEIVTRINESGAAVAASLLSDGTALHPMHLSLLSGRSGRAGRLVIDDGGLGLSLATQQEAKDALLQVGAGAGAFLLASSTNTFQNAINDLDVDVLGTSSQTAEVTVARDNAHVETLVSNLVGNYNTLIGAADELTKFDTVSGERGALQGNGLVLRTISRLDAVITGRIFDRGDLRSLADLGVRLEDGGKLSLDTERLREALKGDPDAVADFFATTGDGLADRLESTIDSLTDPFTGTFSLQKDALQSSIDSLNGRIDELDEILESRRERLLMEFIQMEQAIGALQSQQQAIGRIGPLTPPQSRE